MRFNKQATLGFALIAIGILALATTLTAAPAVPEGMEVFDLSELVDGESREFGQGEHRITATRIGETITVSMPEDDNDPARTVSCLGDDRCLVMVGGDEAANKMIVIKRHHGEDGESEDSDAFVNMMFAGTDDAGEPTAVIMRHDGAGGNSFHFETDDEKSVHIVKVGEDADNVMLRCPEGDTHMSVAKDEAEVDYRCPKHGDLLVKAGGQVHRKVIEKRIIRKQRDGDEN